MTEYVQVMQRRRGPNTSLFEKQQEKLIEMGFAATDVTIVLESTKGDLEMAQEILLNKASFFESITTNSTPQKLIKQSNPALAVHSSTGKSKAVLNTIYKKTTSH
jgi:hypothetical protein